MRHIFSRKFYRDTDHEEGEYRVLYLAKFADAVYVVRAFSKKTRKTSKQDIDLASDRFRAVIEERKRQKR
jgi:phage-related protein